MDTGDDHASETTSFTTSNPAPHPRKKGAEWQKLLSSAIASSMPILFPVVHMFIFISLWGHQKTPVDTKQCKCSCWDTIFKGSFEHGWYAPGFKHVYFNCDMNTVQMWMVTVIGVILMYEGFKHLFLLMLNRKLRWTMVILFLSSLYSHYYAWWNHWNYWNDEFYDQLFHQTFYTVTELVSTVMVLRYLDVERSIRPLPMFIVCSIAVFHALCSSKDQFVENVLNGQGESRQVLRDIGLMMTDAVHAVISLYELQLYATRMGTPLKTVLLHRDHIAIMAAMFLCMLVSIIIFP